MKKKTFASAAALFLAASLTACGGGSETAAADEASATPDWAGTHELTYELTSDGATAKTINYSTASNGESDRDQLLDEPLPYKQETTFEKASEFDSVFSISATAAEDATTISCKITVNGEVKDEQTATGPMAMVRCEGTW